MGVPKLAASVVLTDAQKSEIGSFKLKDFKAKNYLFRATWRQFMTKNLQKNMGCNEEEI